MMDLDPSFATMIQKLRISTLQKDYGMEEILLESQKIPVKR